MKQVYLLRVQKNPFIQWHYTIFLLFILFTIQMFIPSSINAIAQTEIVDIYYFWGDGCKYCEMTDAYLQEINKDNTYIKIHSYEVWNNYENQEILKKFEKTYNINAQGTPVIFIRDKSWIGWSEQIEQEINSAIFGSKKHLYVLDQDSNIGKKTSHEIKNTKIQLPFSISVDLSKQSLIWTTILIAFVDGINPCSLWVLMLLLSNMTYIGSRRKAAIVGITFLAITAIIYGCFILGMLNIFSYVGYIRWIQYLVALLALFYGLINIKDFFWFQKGISFTISKEKKPKIFKNIFNIRSHNKLLGMVGSTAIMALGAVLIELPCTAGFPVVWSSLITSNDINSWSLAFLLLIYLIVYLLDELVVFFIVLITMRVIQIEKKHGRFIKLIGGILMISCSVALFINPKVINSLSISLAVFVLLVIFAISVVMYFITKRITIKKL